MTIAEVQQLFSYNRWANARMLEAAGQLEAEQLTRDLGSSYPSVAATLGHILAAEWVWLARWNGVSPTGVPADWGDNGYAALVARWRAHESAQTSFLNTLDERRLQEPISYRNTKGEAARLPLDQLMRHLINHSTYHRGQVTTLLRQLDQTPPATDYVLYCLTIAAIAAQ